MASNQFPSRIGSTIPATQPAMFIVPITIAVCLPPRSIVVAQDAGLAIPGTVELAVGDEGTIIVEPTFGGVVIEFRQGDFVVGMSATPLGIDDVAGLPELMTAAALEAAGGLP